MANTYGTTDSCQHFEFTWQCHECKGMSGWVIGGGNTSDSWNTMERERQEHLLNVHGISSTPRPLPKKYKGGF